LKDQLQAVEMSIANAVSERTLILSHDTNPFHQKVDIRDLNFEVEKLESAEGVDSAQAATATLHEDWLDITSVDVNFQKSLSNFLEGKLENEKE